MTESNSPSSTEQKNGPDWLLIGIIFGVIAGGIVGSLYPELGVKLGFLGHLFLQALKMLIVPLVFSSMINGITGLGDIRKLGKPGAYTLGFFFITTCIAVVVGLVMVNIIQPGVGVDTTGAAPETHVAESHGSHTPDNLADKQDKTLIGVVTDVLGNMVTDNIISAAAKGDILPLIFFALLFGGILTTVGPVGLPLINFFKAVDAVMMRMVNVIMLFAPIGIFGLIAGRLGLAGGGDEFLNDLRDLSGYASTVIIALLIHGLILLAIHSAITKKSPLAFLGAISTALTTAFSTASSSATVPLTMDSLEENLDVSHSATSFVVPLGATVNMNGTALYEAVAALFIAQAAGIDLSISDQLIVFLTASFAAIGAAGIPEAGLITMVLVLNAVNLPLAGMSLILTIDWFLDRCRTTVNVMSDAVIASSLDSMYFSTMQGVIPAEEQEPSNA